MTLNHISPRLCAEDVDSYLQSGMNDVLAKPFTKNGLFGILDKHLMHLKAIQLSAEVPRSVGLPPLSDQGVVDAVVTGAAQWINDENLRNPLAAMGWSDETYQSVLQVCVPPQMLDKTRSLLLCAECKLMTGCFSVAIPGDGNDARCRAHRWRSDRYKLGLW